VSPVLAPGNAWHWTIAAAEGGLSTPEVFRELDRLRAAGEAPSAAGSTDGILAALRQRDAAVLAKSLVNDLEPAALAMRPALRSTLAAGVAAGALAGVVSGSGPTCAFLCRDADGAALVADALEGSGACRWARTAIGPVPGARLV
jgi:4-diphosphocytidyl-2-C-methyl-D-erythritol kinase